MMRFVWLVVGLLLASPCWADQLCTRRSDGSLIEYQSLARVGTCTANAVASGIVLSDILEETVTPTQWAQRQDDLILKPERDKTAIEKTKRAQRINALRQALGLTPAQWKDLVEAIRNE